MVNVLLTLRKLQLRGGLGGLGLALVVPHRGLQLLARL